MATRRILKHYNLENISGGDIELTLRDYDGNEQTVVFERDEIIHGVTPQTINKLKCANPGILSYVKLKPVWDQEKIDWQKEGF